MPITGMPLNAGGGGKTIARVSDGDARRALNALELALKTTAPDSEGRIVIGLETAENSIQQGTPVR